MYIKELDFYIDDDKHTDRDRLMFSCGAEYQRVYERIKSGDGIEDYILPENKERYEKMCEDLNRHVTFETQIINKRTYILMKIAYQ